MKKIHPADLTRRLVNLPKPTYPEDLPVIVRRQEIMDAIKENQVVIVCGETGSGKTTQLPKICLELKRGVTGLIGHTQPRRIAARTVAKRIAAELNSPLGHTVGYKVRFSDKVSANTYIKLMTDGILLAETQSDPLLQAYDTLIIDEAHERSLNIDFLLGYLKQLLLRRPDLKLIVTSATIDAQRFSRHFNDASVIEVTGRMYPVAVHYRPVTAEDDEDSDSQQAILDAIAEVMQIGSGDILVFLPGEREIRETTEALRKHHFGRMKLGPADISILPLFARLSFSEQERVFKTEAVRRIILATNVAETSLTVPGIRYVIDTGWARVNRYSYRNKVVQLQLEKISRASANQRAGRCGRIASGVCIRLYAEEDYLARVEFTDPEILRSSLAAVILRMKSLKIGDVESFPFIEPPSSRMIADGYRLLAELGAVDDNRQLTRIGWQLAKFPIDPRIARMILAAKDENSLNEVLIIASALSLQDPRDRPFERQDAADRAHQCFQDERSDFLSYLKLWVFFEELLRDKKSHRKLVAQCQEKFLSYRRMREWREIHAQLHGLVMDLGLKPNQVPADYVEIHRALLAGLLGNIGFKTEKESEYLGARGIKFSIFPGSVLKKGKSKWIVVAELIETTKLYGRCVAKIDPIWLEGIAGRLCKQHYSDPHWEKQPAQVIAYERVTLYGLPIVPKRQIHYGKINSQESREIFIRGALVAGEYVTPALFFEHNRKRISEIEELEHKARRQDVLVDEQAIFSFYDAIVPMEIYNGAGFEKWRKQAERENPQLLYLSRTYLMRHEADRVTEAQFPENMQLDGKDELPLSYRFEPGHVLDGVTVSVPLPLLNQLDAKQFDYLVPGLIREKITWHFKALPKQIRRYLIPLPESVTQFLQSLQVGVNASALSDLLATFVLRKTGTSVPVDAWTDKDLPIHLLMNFKVVDDAGEELAMSRNLVQLQAQLGQVAQLTFSQPDSGEQVSIERDNVMRWDFGDLPVEIIFTRMGKQLTGYPTLLDEEDSVAIRLLDTRDAAEESMRAGMRRLLCFELKDNLKYLDKKLSGLKQVTLQFTALISPDVLKQDMLTVIVDRAFIGEDVLPRSEHLFTVQKQRARARLPTVAEALIYLMQNIGNEYQSFRERLSGVGKNHQRLKSELSIQLENLIYPGFLGATQWERLQHFPRYLKGMSMRLDKFSLNPVRDERHESDIALLWKQYIQRLEKHREVGVNDASLAEFRWQIEELRISLFAQELKTPYPVSAKRLQRLWEKIRG
ncbi:ATP-dependent helicase HrpA [Nitrosomonas cryotolerans]|uniref:ATP-dependent helicase HrpA n=1 Tax=Nitrosomonas cryotolerans ATCC 49181 TaxID=1131553 RepID=A0A1N6J5I8_9PROT|nr:ATP-dependent RNA helicase HrpA [Nitrosomonas cryotolerans]SFP45981.1 ATP-dependent helicase HrpA [Nitrosomonas cryotolerans]SIO39503.1 ATP-dependent helicase HrpA [Nitrosomonas cryotolerans ATCC 49181]